MVLVFGEHDHDRRAIRHLTEGFRPDLRGRVEPRRSPLVLIKNATQATARTNAQKIAAVVRQEAAAREVLAVLAHEDCDAVEPAHDAVAAKIERELSVAGCPAPAIAVTPAWAIETWWMIFPEAAKTIVLGWRSPDDWIGKDVGTVQKAKERFKHAVQPRPRPPSPPREYAEEDSIVIAANIVKNGLLPSFSNGRRTTVDDRGGLRHTRSWSFEAFRVKVLGIRGPT